MEKTTIETEQKLSANNIRIRVIQCMEGNQICADCFTNESKFVNLSFGVFLCGTCAYNHKLVFIDMPERLKSLDFNSFTNCEVNIVSLGGNKSFNAFLDYYGINAKETNLENKYLYEAVLYYIKLLYNNAHGNDFKEQRPQIKDGAQRINVKDIRDYRGFSTKMKQTFKKMFSYKRSEQDEIAITQINNEMAKENNLGLNMGTINIDSFKNNKINTNNNDVVYKSTTVIIEKDKNNENIKPTM